MACPSPGGGGGGGRGKTMPRLRRGDRRERARRAGRPGARRLPGGACRSEAPASAPPRPDAAGDRAGIRQPPPSPPPPPGGLSKSLDLGEYSALSGITTRAGRRPREPSQVTGTPTQSFHAPPQGSCSLPAPFLTRSIWPKVRGRSSRSRGPAPSAGRATVTLEGPVALLCAGWAAVQGGDPLPGMDENLRLQLVPRLVARWKFRRWIQGLLVFFNPGK